MRRDGVVVQAPWIARMAATLRDELGTIIREQEEGRALLLRRGVPPPQPPPPPSTAATAAGATGGGGGDLFGDEEADECCALCKSMPYLAVVHCSECWRAAEAVVGLNSC
jgi:hypothetical protein